MDTIALKPDALRKLPLFSSLTDTQLAWIAPAIKQRTYAARACILRAGETPDGLFVVLSGRLRVVHDDERGHSLIAGDIRCNEFFGEMGLIDSTPCPASIHAIESCEVLHIPKKILLECIQDNAAAAVYMLRTVVNRLCDAHHKMANLALMTVHGRVARVLLDHARDANGEWLVEPGSEQIAAMVGASREMVSRVIKNMIGNGLVRRFKRKIIVLDRAALDRACADHRLRTTA